METREIVILANSRRHGGHCIAGKDLTTGQWIRPINIGSSARDDPATFREDDLDRLFGDAFGPKLLDCVRIEYGESCPASYQPENISISGGVWERLKSFPRARLPSLEDRAPMVWLGRRDPYSDSIPARDVLEKPLLSSLCLIHLTKRDNDVKVHHTTSRRGSPQHRLRFTYDMKEYDLVITDYAYESSANARTNNDDRIFEDCYVTVGVGGEFKPDSDSYGLHYRFIVGVIPAGDLNPISEKYAVHVDNLPVLTASGPTAPSESDISSSLRDTTLTPHEGIHTPHKPGSPIHSTRTTERFGELAWEIDPDDISDDVLLEEAYELQTYIDELKGEMKRVTKLYTALINRAEDSGTLDRGPYRLVTKETPRRKVLPKLFYAKYPDIFVSIAKVSVGDAEKLVGKAGLEGLVEVETLTKTTIEYVGRKASYQTVTDISDE